MSNTATVVNQSATAAEKGTVVLNDIINNGFKVSITNTGQPAQKPAQTKEASTVVLLQKLITERKAWEADAYRTSN